MGYISIRGTPRSINCFDNEKCNASSLTLLLTIKVGSEVAVIAFH